jgi:hypothetical protein
MTRVIYILKLDLLLERQPSNDSNSNVKHLVNSTPKIILH